MRARGRSSPKDSSSFFIALIWHLRSPALSQNGKLFEAGAERCGLVEPASHGVRFGEAEHLPRAGLGIASVGEARQRAGAFIDEGQGYPVLDPLEARPPRSARTVPRPW